MAERKPEWQDAGNLIITPKEMVPEHGAYANLDELQGTFRRVK